MKKLLLILVAVAAALFSPALRADNYPSKPITLVAVFGPGSASDTICRVIAQPLSAALKESVIVENRPGANGALAAQYVARSAPDGYTLLMAYAKANPGRLSFASANTSGIVAGETLKHWAEIDLLHVPYKSAPPALQ